MKMKVTCQTINAYFQPYTIFNVILDNLWQNEMESYILISN